MVSPRQHNKAKLIYRAGVEPPHQCTARCREMAAEIAKTEACTKCNSRHELLYYNGQHLVSRFHEDNCPARFEHLYAKEVKGYVDGKLVTEEADVEKLFECPLGCQIKLEHGPVDTTIRHQLDCPMWTDKPLQPR